MKELGETYTTERFKLNFMMHVRLSWVLGLKKLNAATL